MQKNTASQKFVVFAFNRTTNVPLTGDAANITANLQKDFGTSTATNDVNPTELEDGFYSFDATQAETNADTLVVYPASVTSDIQVIAVPGVIYTVSTGSPDEVVQTADHTAGIADVPTVSEFNARTLVAASYFDPAADTVANVTLCATTTTLTGHTAQTGDSFARIGTAGAGLSNIDLPNQTMDITGNLSGSVGSVSGSVGSVTGAVGSVTGSVGSVSGNVDGSTASVVGAVGSVTGAVGSVTSDVGITQAGADKAWSTTTRVLTAGTNLNDISVSDVLTTQMTEAYAADGTAPTLAQAIFLIQQTIGDFAIAGTTITTKKIDGATTAATYTLDDGTNPTSRTRTT